MHQRPVVRRNNNVGVSGPLSSSSTSTQSGWKSNSHTSNRRGRMIATYRALVVVVLVVTALLLLLVLPVPTSLPLTNLWLGSSTIAPHTSSSQPVRVAHVVSLISCKKKLRVQGLLDALVILRHSIHQNSVHRIQDDTTIASSSSKARHQTSKYSYQMYVFLHKDGGCLDHIPLLKRLGYTPLVRDTPVNISDIQPITSWYRNHVEGENCCGSKEFIKLYAYTLTDHPIVVHWDLDVLVLQPLDDLYDAMLYSADSIQGKMARRRIAIQKPYFQSLPSQIDAFFTRDITSARPWETVTAVQGGFLVARPSLEHFEQYQRFIMEANYTPGRGPGSGWGGLGYGGFQGAMAYQGVLAYFYDIVYPGHSVELDVCQWNQVVADVIWRGPVHHQEFYGQCRDHPAPGVSFAENTPENGKCRDCRVLAVEDTMTAHYTACKKVCTMIVDFSFIEVLSHIHASS